MRTGAFGPFSKKSSKIRSTSPQSSGKEDLSIQICVRAHLDACLQHARAHVHVAVNDRGEIDRLFGKRAEGERKRAEVRT